MVSSTVEIPLPKLDVPMPDVPHWQDGEVRLVGHRISLFHIVKEYEFGSQAESIALQFL